MGAENAVFGRHEIGFDDILALVDRQSVTFQRVFRSEAGSATVPDDQRFWSEGLSYHDRVPFFFVVGAETETYQERQQGNIFHERWSNRLKFIWREGRGMRFS